MNKPQCPFLNKDLTSTKIKTIIIVIPIQYYLSGTNAVLNYMLFLDIHILVKIEKEAYKHILLKDAGYLQKEKKNKALE